MPGMLEETKKTGYILGISAYYHDSAAALLHNGLVVAAVQEERFSRKKHDAAFPAKAIAYCLDEAGVELDDLDAVVFYEKPFIKFERLLETYYALAPRGLVSYLAAMPSWLSEKLFLKRQIKNALGDIMPYQQKQLKLLFSTHHLSHAASAFYPSPFAEAAILTIDGVGEWATASISKGSGKNIEVLEEQHFPHSLGLLYSAFTYFLGFKVNSGEYKLMGLAPYGADGSDEVAQFTQKIEENLARLQDDGSMWLNQDYFRYAGSLKMINTRKWEQLFDLRKRPAESGLTQQHGNLAMAIQHFTEKVVIAMARRAKAITGANALCMAGGVALNCVANGKLQKAGIFQDLYIQPAAGDAGGAIGAALAVYHQHFNQERQVLQSTERSVMKGAYLGPSFSKPFVAKWATKTKHAHTLFASEEALCKEVAKQLEAGKVVGWFQGKMEFGPRALGNRSILADPRNRDMQKTLNLKIKKRESFRPFAPAILAEKAANYFDLAGDSPYMLLVQQVLEQYRLTKPADFDDLALQEKLKVPLSDFPAITHLDYSARIQTVHRELNPLFWQLLRAFDALTGCPMLVNTSFNVRGEPIVCTPNEAMHCFLTTEMDVLVVENTFFAKT